MAQSLMSGQVRLQVIAPGVDSELSLVPASAELLEACHFSSDHWQNLLSSTKYRVICFVDGAIAGLSTLEPVGKYAHLADTVVSRKFEDYGLDTIMEYQRDALRIERGLIPYASCITIGVRGQALKAARGMQPINIRYGYWRFRPDARDVRSAVTYLGSPRLPGIVTTDSTEIDNKNGRIRVSATSISYLTGQVPIIQSFPSYYVEALIPPSFNPWTMRDLGFKFAGIDVDIAVPYCGVLWQYKNEVYNEGQRGGGDFNTEPDIILRNVMDSCLGSTFS